MYYIGGMPKKESKFTSFLDRLLKGTNVIVPTQARDFLNQPISNFTRNHGGGGFGNPYEYTSTNPLNQTTPTDAIIFISLMVSRLTISIRIESRIDRILFQPKDRKYHSSLTSTLTSQASATLTSRQLMYNLARDMLAYGNAYCFINKSAGVIALEYLPTQIVEASEERNRDRPFNTKIEYKVNGTEVSSAEILHIPWRPGGGKLGIGFAASFPRLVGTGNELDTLRKKLTNHVPTGVLTSNETMTPADQKDIKERFEDDTRNSASGLVVLEKGSMTYTPSNINPQVLQLEQQYKDYQAQVYRAFNLPDRFGLNEKNATMDDQTTELMLACIAPLADAIDDELTSKLITSAGYIGEIKIDPKSIRKLDFSSGIRSAALAVKTGIVSINEARVFNGLKPKAGAEHDELQKNIADTASPEAGQEMWGTKSPDVNEDIK